MNDAFIKIIYETERDFNNALEKWNSFSKRKEKTQKILTEAYGSFPGQFESVESVAEKIYDTHYVNAENNIWNVDLRENISGAGNVRFVSHWYNSPSPYETPVRAAKQKNDGETVT